MKEKESLKIRMLWWVIQMIFTVSGACGLGYEIIWGRWLSTVLGSSTTSTSIVLATFMGGMAVGAWCFGELSRRVRSPLTLYALVELGIGVTAGLLPYLTSFLLGVPFFLRIALVVLCLFFPTFLMGGTVPLIMSWSEGMKLPAGASIGKLYGLNTLGASVGCLAAGFWLIPTFGLYVTNGLAASLNAIIALCVFLLRNAGARDHLSNADSYRRFSRPTPPQWALHAVAFGSGFVTFALEVLWIRLLRITLGSVTYTFTIVIATFIVGMGIGGMIAGFHREEMLVEKRLAYSQMGLIGLLLAQFLLLPFTPQLFTMLKYGNNSWHNALIGTAFVCMMSLFPVALLFGYMFPLVARLYMLHGQRGSKIGIMYMVNTIGAVSGSLLTTILFVPMMGSAASYLVCIGMMFLSLAIYVRIAHTHLTYRPYIMIGALCLCFLSLAAYRPGWTAAYLGRTAFRTHNPLLKNLYFQEGTISTVLVEEVASGRGMLIDGKPVASTTFIDRLNQILLGHFPALLSNAFRHGMVIGLGTGMTLDSLAQHQFEHVDIVELEKTVFVGATYFSEYNHHVLERPEVATIVDDGFNYLHQTRSQYDVITSDPIQPFFRSASTLYSSDYFARARQRLTPDGVMAHWLPLAQMSVEDFKMIVRSFTDVFPYARLYWTGGLFDTVLVGKNRPWTAMSAEHFEDAKRNLFDMNIESVEEVEALLIADQDILLRWAGDGPRNTIDLPFLEFSASRSLFMETGRENLQQLRMMRAQMPSRSGAWQAISILLAYQSNIAPLRDDALSQHLLWKAISCDPSAEQTCPLVASSGLLRRQLWELALRQGEQAFLRYRAAVALGNDENRSQPGNFADIFLREQLEKSLSAFELAHRLTSRSRPDETQLFNQQIDIVKQSLPLNSAERLRANKLAF